MNSFNHDRLIKRTIAFLGATGLAAFSGLPAFAQVNSNNRSVDCSAYVNSGVGGPTNNSSQSSYDTATIPQNRSSDSLNQSNTNYSPGVSGNSAVSANQSNADRSSYNTAMIPQNRSDMMNSNNSSIRYNSSGMRRDGQFSATNPNAAVPFRSNGPAGTSGGESNLNLRVFSANNRNSSMQSAMMGNSNRAYSAPDQSSSYQSVNPLPVECLPGGVNKR
ncbi:MAG: hypothetical protein LH660_07250 [Phormidesmis sp. CAN_BIN36]|nr:hypothetical protein [Phormidesmis sp. CAN_BIN36]